MATPYIQIVVAYSQNHVIGRNNQLPWRLPADLAHFKRTTLGKPIIMGRKTWESLGRPLPGRLNLVISKNPQFTASGAQVYSTLEQALTACQGYSEVCIIGGEQIFKVALDLSDEVIATEIQSEIDGDTFFPALDINRWQEVERLPQPPENGLAYDFVRYRRKT